MPTANELNINTSASALDMANEIFGDGVTVTGATYSGDAASSGIYTGATATLEGAISPTDSGVILSTGNATDFTNSSGTADTNTTANTGTNTAGGIDGDALLDAVAGQATFDGAILETTFTATGDTLTMQFVFSSEEYLEYTNSGVNDAFGVWVNGEQIDLSFNDERVSIDTINDGSNQNLYVDNPAATDPYNTEMDGFSVVLSIKAPLQAGENTLRIGIADGGDSVYDSNVMVAANSVQSFTLAFDDDFTLGQNSTAVLAPLANDTDLTGGGLTITQINGEDVVIGVAQTLSTGETVTVNADSTITVTTDSDIGSNTFTYTIEDATGNTDVGFVTLTTEATGSVTADGYVDGTSGADLIDSSYTGDPNGDVVDGGDRILPGTTADDDVIRAFGGDDTVLAGVGNDSVDGGSGDDSVFGEAGDDTLEGGTGADTLDGGDDNDSLVGGADDDSLLGGAGSDTLEGGEGTDTLLGGAGTDTLDGGAGADTLLGGGSDDVITDTDGASSVEGGDGDDTITTGDANDLIYGDNASGDFAYTTTGSNLIVNGSFEDLTGTTTTSFGAQGVGSIVGWSSDDPTAEFDLHNDGKGGTFATDGSYVLDMGGTPDNLDVYQDVAGLTDGTFYELSFDAGDLAGLDNNIVEVYFGGELIATIDPGAGTMDSFTFIVTGGMGDGTDRLRFNEIGPEDVDGLQIDNITLFEAVPETSDDSIDAGSGDDTVFAGSGDDTVVAGGGADSISGNEGNDSLEGGAGNDSILGGDGNDAIFGGADDDSLEGGTGDDSIVGGSGDDFLRGSFGNDSLQGGTGDDYLWGGFGDDTIVLENDFGNDTIEGEEDEETTGDVLDLSSITDDLTVDLSAANPETGTVSDGVSTASFVEIENVVLGAGADTLVLADFGGADTIQGFTGPITNPDGSYTAVDMLDVTALTSDFGTTPVNARDVVVSDDGSGNAVLTFPGGESLTLVGIDPVAASDPAWLVAVGIPSNEIVDGTSGDDAMGTTFVDTEGDQTDGTDGLDDTIYGYGGNDTIDGGLGADTIEGGSGDDSIDGGAGADTILGGTDNDTISGGAGVDTVDGGTGADSISGGNDSDADILTGGFGDDTIVLEGGADTADGQSGDDTFELENGFGNASIIGGEDGETNGDTLDLSNMTDDATVDLSSIFPEEGSVTSGTDTVTFQEIENIVLGGGTDTLVLADGSGGDTVDGFEAPTDNGDGTYTGNDLLDVTNLNSDLAGTVPVTTADVTVVDDGSGNAQLIFPNGENLTLVGIDPVTADNPAFLVAIGIPNDGVVSGYGADDTIDGSYTGDLDGDLVDSADGLDDTIEAGGGNDVVLAGDGNDTVFGEDGNDTLAGEGGNNTLIGGAGDDVFVGGAGADSFVGDAGTDIVDYSDSAAPVNVDLGNGLTSGGDAGNDTLGFAIEGVTGSTGDDTLFGGDSADTNVIDGNDGDDAIDGRGGADSLEGGAGDDTIVLGEGNDTASGGADADTFILDSDADGNDTNTVSGGETGTDDDTLDFTNVTTSGVQIVAGATESGTATWGGNEVFYVEIENIVGTDLDDTVDGALDTSGLDIDAGDGDDSLVGGSGDDVFEGGGDDDTLEGGSGDDTLTGGVGDDSIDGGADDDNLTGGVGSDTIAGSSGSDIIDAGDDADVVLVGDGDGADVIDGGSGGVDEDTLDAGAMTEDALIDFTSNEGGTLTSSTTSASFSDIEAIEAGAGDDTIDGSATTGGITASGGAGDDSLIGGTGLDNLSGGDDDDTFSGVFIGDTVDGGDGGTDSDTLDLTGTAAPGGSLQINVSGPDSDGNGFDGVVEYYDNTGTLTGTMSFSNIENFVPCFTPGTLIKTPCGERAVENLVPGDRVLTRDNGFQTIRWAGQRVLERADLERNPELRPVLIRAGALGDNIPERDMMVSPQHRMLVTSAQAELYFGEEEVLIAAVHLTCIDGVEQVDVEGVCYVHILFDFHEIVMSDGTWSESFQPGDLTMAGMNSEQREEIFKLFPELKTANAETVFPAARATLRAHEAQVILLS